MEVSELRIGNLLHDRSDRLCKVDCITKQSFSAPPFSGPFTGLPYKPVLLTEEWIKKIGFKKIQSDTVYYGKNRIIVEFVEGQFEYLTATRTTIILKTVHQLQNLFFALTGEELIYKP